MHNIQEGKLYYDGHQQSLYNLLPPNKAIIRIECNPYNFLSSPTSIATFPSIIFIFSLFIKN